MLLTVAAVLAFWFAFALVAGVVIGRLCGYNDQPHA